MKFSVGLFHFTLLNDWVQGQYQSGNFYNLVVKQSSFLETIVCSSVRQSAKITFWPFCKIVTGPFCCIQRLQPSAGARKAPTGGD